MWQDIAIAICGLVFLISAFPDLSRKTRIPILSSLPSAVTMTALAVIYFTLGLYISVTTLVIEASIGFFLVFRRRA